MNWLPPKNALWTIAFDQGKDLITIAANGEAVAWGGFHYEDHLVDTFRRYQWAAQMPDCAKCGHGFYAHLAPSGFSLRRYVPRCDQRNHPPFRAVCSSRFGCKAAEEACMDCVRLGDCPGYAACSALEER